MPTQAKTRVHTTQHVTYCTCVHQSSNQVHAYISPVIKSRDWIYPKMIPPLKPLQLKLIRKNDISVYSTYTACSSFIRSVKLWDLRRTYSICRLEPPLSWYSFSPVGESGRRFGKKRGASKPSDVQLIVVLSVIIFGQDKYFMQHDVHTHVMTYSNDFCRVYLTDIRSLAELFVCFLH